MEEIFTDIPQSVKDRAEFIFSLAWQQKNILHAVDMLDSYTKTCIDEGERDFVRFYFNMRMEQMLNEDNSNQR